MHTKIFSILLVMLVVFCGSLARADGEQAFATPSEKLKSGATNVATGWIEIPKSVVNTTNESHIFFGITGGLVKGIVNTVGRTLVGLNDVLTFPFRTKPVVDPDFVAKDMRQETVYRDFYRVPE